ncbi:cullin-associated NEDD8-dissociated protein 1 [[Candida] anglica]
MEIQIAPEFQKYVCLTSNCFVPYTSINPTMSEINLNGLYDKALDVDPDLRFMALEDLKKYLSSSPSVTTKGLEKFIPILFRLLKDSNPDVQSQAVKSFAPLVVFLSPGATLEVIRKLYEQVQLENEKDSKKITISIPNMALRSIFSSNAKFPYQTSRGILDLLIPSILSSVVAVDSIEILTYLIKYLGNVLSPDEERQLALALIQIVFGSNGLVSKRAVVALDSLLQYLDNDDSSSELLNELVLAVSTSSPNVTSLSLSLYSVLLNNSSPKTDSSSLLTDDAIAHIYDKIVQSLLLPSLYEEFDTADFDYDSLVQQCSAREDALITLTTLIKAVPYAKFAPFLGDTFEYIKACLKYDPLNFGDDEDYQQDDTLDSDIEFSDDEDGFNNDSDDNDCSWKLRKQAASVSIALSVYYGDILPLVYSNLVTSLISSFDDRNDFVSDEAIASVTSLISATAANEAFYVNKASSRRNSDASMAAVESDPLLQLSSEVLPRVQDKLFHNLLVEKKTARFSIFLKLIESCSVANEGLPEDFLNQLYDLLTRKRMKTNGVAEYLNLYKVIIQTNSAQDISIQFVNYIVDDLSKSISNEQAYHNIIMESLNTSIVLFVKFRLVDLGHNSVDGLYRAIYEKCHNKAYSSELRQKAISSMGELFYNIKLQDLNKGIEVFQEGLNYDATLRTAVENLGRKIFDEQCANREQVFSFDEFVQIVVGKLVQVIVSTDESLYISSLKALLQIAKRGGIPQSNDTVKQLLTFARQTEDAKQLLLTFGILHSLVKNSDNIIEESFVDSIIEIAGTKLVDMDGINLNDYSSLINEMTHKADPRELFFKFSSSLNLNQYISAKTLSIVAIAGDIRDVIAQSERELLNGVNILFNVQFLGNVGASIKLEDTNIDTFFGFFNSENEEIRLAAAKATGLFIHRDVTTYLPTLLERYTTSEVDRELILVAFREILTANNSDLQPVDLNKIWSRIWQIQENETRNEIKTSESKFAGYILAKICKLESHTYVPELIAKTEESNLTLTTRYTLIAVLKQLLSIQEDGEDGESYILQYFLSTLKFFDIVNILIKQALMGTLLTGLHNKPLMFFPILQSEILPRIYNELEAKPEFKKTIPMGPYKYNIDEGLEIRKLTYEFLNAILSIDKDLTVYGVSYFEIINNILDKGCKDSESDIIVLSSINLSIYINKRPEILLEENILEKLSTQVKLVLNKKLKAKPSRQEAENYDECQKSILKLCKIVNKGISLENNKNGRNITVRGKEYSEWSAYYNELKSSYDMS